MGLLDKFTRRFTQSATVAVKTEVRKTVVDLIPTIAGIASTVIGFFIFKDAVKETPKEMKPAVKNTSITTNNYFFQEVNEELMKRILEERR